MSSRSAIPRIDVAPLFAGPSPLRDRVDAAILAAARQSGFMTIGNLPADLPLDAAHRRALLRIFDLPPAETHRLWRQKFAAGHRNIYRGWFPLQNGAETYKEGIDLGPDIAYGADRVAADDPLREPTPVPPEATLAGWRDAAASYFRAMERVGAALMHALARGLNLSEGIFDDSFAGGISTLRLIRYPVRPPESMAGIPEDRLWVENNGSKHYMLGRAHVDSGLVTLLAQDGVSGLQARGAEGTWIDVPPEDGTLAVNFGKLLESWTGGRIRATEHRVIGQAFPGGQERCSVPFFYEPRTDAEIRPLPLPGIDFEPFVYGDYLWSTMTKFVEFHGLEGLRRPQGR
jgi:isopenicillin N synthase-like dioxygenase